MKTFNNSRRKLPHMETANAAILKELKTIRKELQEIKETIPDKEMFLTTEETKLLMDSYEHEKEGKLVSSKDLKRELGL